MNVYVFIGSSEHYGFTTDATGENLPEKFGPWYPRKSIELLRDQPRIAVDVNEAIDDIEKVGWHVNQASIKFEIKLES